MQWRKHKTHTPHDFRIVEVPITQCRTHEYHKYCVLSVTYGLLPVICKEIGRKTAWLYSENRPLDLIEVE